MKRFFLVFKNLNLKQKYFGPAWLFRVDSTFVERTYCLLVGAFSVKSARLLHWLVFFVRPLCMYPYLYVPLSSIDNNRFTGNSAVAGSSLCLSQKLFRAFAKPDETEESSFEFFCTVRLFSISFVPLSNVFFTTNRVFKKPKGSPLVYF